MKIIDKKEGLVTIMEKGNVWQHERSYKPDTVNYLSLRRGFVVLHMLEVLFLCVELETIAFRLITNQSLLQLLLMIVVVSLEFRIALARLATIENKSKRMSGRFFRWILPQIHIMRRGRCIRSFRDGGFLRNRSSLSFPDSSQESSKFHQCGNYQTCWWLSGRLKIIY